MTRSLICYTIVFAVTAAFAASPAHPQTGDHPVPHPRDVLGFTPGDDYQMADFTQMKTYFQALADSSPRVTLSSAGKTTGGRDMLVAVISSEENLARITEYKDIARRLASARGLTDADAQQLAKDGKAIVWIDNGLHAQETAHAQHSFLLAHKMATDETDEVRFIRDNVILVLLPCVNPDGLDLMADWYRKTVHTPHQDSPMPWIFNKYAHWENNRDYYMQAEPEAQVVSRLLYTEWLPQVMYNHHQGFYPARIFVPPFPDPFNPNIDPGVIRGIELVGAAMQRRFEREGKDGVLSRYGFSSWYNGSLRTTTYFHNVVGILSETTHDSPSPFYYDPEKMPATFGNGWSTTQPSTNYARPWRGDTLHFRDALDYMLTGSMAVLDVTARFRDDFLYGIYQMGARQISLGKTEPPVAYVVPRQQHDPPVVAKFIETLMRGAVEVHQAQRPFTAAGQTFDAGSYVISLAQPYRPYIKDLLEPQRYPDIRQYPGGPPIPPYDNAGWTLSFQMGVQTVAIAEPFSVDTVLLRDYPAPSAPAALAAAEYGYALSPNLNASLSAVNRLLAAGHIVRRATEPLVIEGRTVPAGAFILPNAPGLAEPLSGTARELGLDVIALETEPAISTREVTAPRIGVYKSWVVEWVDGFTSGEGWARYVLDHHEFAYASLSNEDIQAGGLASRFDVILIPSQDVDDIIGGYRKGRAHFGMVHQNLPPPEYQGGIETTGIAALRAFVEQGGTLILADKAADLGTEYLNLPVSNVLRDLPATEFFGPGSIVHIETDPSHPVAFGMPTRTMAYFRKSRAYEFDDPNVRSIAQYPADTILASGWLLGETHMRSRHAAVDVALGRGRIVLMGFPAYFRAQPHATFKLLFNAIHLGPPTPHVP